MEVLGTGCPRRSNNERTDGLPRKRGKVMLERTKGRTRKRFPNNRRLAQKPPLGLNLVHHEPARLINEGGVQRRVLREDEFHSHRVSRWGEY